MATNLIPIEALVPHRAPMILIDSLEEASEVLAICAVEIHADSLFLEGAAVPALVGLEYMAQAIAAHGGYLARAQGGQPKVGFLLGTPQLQCHVPDFPMGSQLKIVVSHDWSDAQLTRYHGKIFDRGTEALLQEADLSIFHPEDLGGYLGQNQA